ncbi:MAG: hypothetical protein ABI383_13965, partial [Acidobacteriaceae bacterium]
MRTKMKQANKIRPAMNPAQNMRAQSPKRILPLVFIAYIFSINQQNNLHLSLQQINRLANI